MSSRNSVTGERTRRSARTASPRRPHAGPALRRFLRWIAPGTLGTLGLPGCLVGFDLDLDHPAEREETHALQLAAGETLDLASGFGSIRVSVGEGAPELVARLHASGRTSAEAEAVLERYRLELRRVGDDTLSVRLVGEPLEIEEQGTHVTLSASVGFSARVPAGTHLVAETGSGGIVASGPLGSSRLESGFGAIEVEDVQGGLEVESGSGRIAASRLKGGSVLLDSGFGAVELSATEAERVRCHTGSGRIEVRDLRAERIELETGFGAVQLEHARGDLQVRSGSGELRLLDIQGELSARSDFGAIRVEGVLSALELGTGSGSIRVRALPTSRASAPWSLRSDFGSLELELPADFGCELDASSDFGRIECDFPLLSEAGQRSGERLRGRIGAGGSALRLRSGSGHIALKQL